MELHTNEIKIIEKRKAKNCQGASQVNKNSSANAKKINQIALALFMDRESKSLSIRFNLKI